MGQWLQAQLNKVGVTTDSIPLGKQEIEGQTLDLPPVLVGKIGADPKKKTILIYGHFDVQPVRPWSHFRERDLTDALCRPTSAMAGTPIRSN